MRIGVYAVGRMKSGPERELAERYFDRFAKLGPSLGLEFAGVDELPENRDGEAVLGELLDVECVLGSDVLHIGGADGVGPRGPRAENGADGEQQQNHNRTSSV